MYVFVLYLVSMYVSLPASIYLPMYLDLNSHPKKPRK